MCPVCFVKHLPGMLTAPVPREGPGAPSLFFGKAGETGATCRSAPPAPPSRRDPETVSRLTDAYRPYRMWVTFLLRVAAGRGVIPGLAGRESEIRGGARGRGG